MTHFAIWLVSLLLIVIVVVVVVAYVLYHLNAKILSLQKQIEVIVSQQDTDQIRWFNDITDIKRDRMSDYSRMNQMHDNIKRLQSAVKEIQESQKP
jgi:predicted PurR-regulated permease PerM